MERKLIIHILLLAGFLTYTSEACQYARGVEGICRDIRQCPTVLRDLRNRVRFPVSCGTFNGRFPVVCCPAGDGSSGPAPNVDISDPLPNLACGKPTPVPAIGDVRASISPGSLPIKPLVVGGRDSLVDAWPWMALLGFRESPNNIDWFCAGSLINNQWILTAAHCFDQRRVNVIRLGEFDYTSESDGARPIDLGVGAPVIFPNYTFPQAYHDLALLKLESRVTFQNGIKPACLPWGDESNRNLEGERVTITGWGDTLFGGQRSNTLQEVEVTVFPTSDCDRSYRNLRQYSTSWPQGIGSESLCSGDRDGGKDACQGDSGGPMVFKDSRGRFTLCGVISLGHGCGDEDFPGLYVNVKRPEYLAWIKRVAF